MYSVLDSSSGRRLTFDRRKYFCPNCGAPVVCGELFCINCGVNFNWVAAPAQESAASQSAQQQRAQRSVSSIPPPKAAEGGVVREKIPPAACSRPLSSDLSKLLSNFFDKHAGTAGR